MARFYGKRRDANHFAIGKAFVALGCSVIDVSQTPCGFDWLIGYGGLTMPVEVKNPEADNWTKRSKKRRTAEVLLTKGEKKVHATWTGGKRLVMDNADVAETVNTLRRWHRLMEQHLVHSCDDGRKAPSSRAMP